MRIHHIRPLATAALVSLLAGCTINIDRGSDAASATTVTSESSSTSSVVVDSTAVTSSTMATATTKPQHNSGGSTGTAKTTTTTTPAAQPAEAALAEAPTSMKPVVLTLTGPLAMSCATLTLAGSKGTITWTTGHATSVSLTVNSSRGISGLAANGSRTVTLQCGRTNIITVTPLSLKGAGDPKQFQVTVGA